MDTITVGTIVISTTIPTIWMNKEKVKREVFKGKLN